MVRARQQKITLDLSWRRYARSVAIAAAFTSAMMLCSTAIAQTYPSKAVKIIVPFPAGGPLDFAARLLADKLSASLRQPCTVDNRPGAGGNIGTDAVAKAPPDGTTLLLVLDTVLTANPSLYQKLPFEPEQDLKPISILASYNQMLVVHPLVPVNTVAEFIAFARRQKDRPLTYATGGGNGSPGHLTMEYFRARASFPMLQVPYKGAAPAVNDLLAGQVQSAFGIAAAMLPHVREGRLKAIAVSSIHRTPLAPDVPTIAEAGYPGFSTEFYFVILVPVAVSESIAALLESEILRAFKSPEIQEKLRSQGLEPLVSTGAEAKALLKVATEQWRRVIKDANIRPD